MRPVLFELGPVAVHSWGIVVAVAFAAAWLALRSELERLAGQGEAAFALAMAAATGGLLGARLYCGHRSSFRATRSSASESFAGMRMPGWWPRQPLCWRGSRGP